MPSSPRVQSPVRLRTRRLVLRPLTRRDAAFYLRHFSLQEIVHGQAFRPPQDLAAAREELERYVLRPRNEGTAFRWGLAMKGRRGLIGTCGYYGRQGDQVEIGYELNPAYWGRGLMREALLAMLNLLSHAEGVRRVVAKVPSWNDRSMRLLRGLGFRRAGVRRAPEAFEGRPVDDVLFVLTRKGSLTSRRSPSPRSTRDRRGH